MGSFFFAQPHAALLISSPPAPAPRVAHVTSAPESPTHAGRPDGQRVAVFQTQPPGMLSSGTPCTHENGRKTGKTVRSALCRTTTPRAQRVGVFRAKDTDALASDRKSGPGEMGSPCTLFFLLSSISFLFPPFPFSFPSRPLALRTGTSRRSRRAGSRAGVPQPHRTT